MDRPRTVNCRPRPGRVVHVWPDPYSASQGLARHAGRFRGLLCLRPDGFFDRNPARLAAAGAMMVPNAPK